MPTLTEFSYDEIALYLTDGYWNDVGSSRHSHGSSSISVDIIALTSTGRAAARWALESWEMVSGITFSFVSSGADITFDDSDVNSAWATSSFVNVGTGWNSWDQDDDSYYYQTFMHEIGHALGLGHAGNYNGTSGGYQTDGTGGNQYLNDSWQMSVMSYFSTQENTTVTSWPFSTYLLTPMVADILAIWDLYGTPTDVRLGATIYGEGSTSGGYYDTDLTAVRAFTLVDNGGIDTINFSSVTADQTVDLRPGTISSVGGLTGNMIIMVDTIIENFFSGSGDDYILGNSAKNYIKGGGGADEINGGRGDDILKGNGGKDIIKGGLGDDILRGGGGADRLFGNDGNDTLYGGNGRDKLTGGAGEDTFVFKDGWAVDRITDFEDNIDTIKLDDALWGGGMTIATMLATFGTEVGSHVELDFGGGDKLKIFGISSVNDLLDDITIF